jgi:hypothetical protein
MVSTFLNMEGKVQDSDVTLQDSTLHYWHNERNKLQDHNGMLFHLKSARTHPARCNTLYKSKFDGHATPFSLFLLTAALHWKQRKWSPSALCDLVLAFLGIVRNNNEHKARLEAVLHDAVLLWGQQEVFCQHYRLVCAFVLSLVVVVQTSQADVRPPEIFIHGRHASLAERWSSLLHFGWPGGVLRRLYIPASDFDDIYNR